ncbi:MAG: phosphatidylserine decarboxylase [Gammaproteobacteria bacterium]|nr:phosphatidylserine decarboxylase [Gammaproteobacteria bacterium]
MIPIAREVQLVLLVLGLAVALAQYLFGFSAVWPAWLMFAVLLLLFRDFKRTIPAIPLAVVSPVDGHITDVRDAVHDPYLKRMAQSVSLRQASLGEFNVHSPIEGKVQNLWVRSATGHAESELAVWVQTDEQDDVVMVANLSSALRHASCHISAGEKLGQGQRCGFMALACEVVVYLPQTSSVSVRVNQSVRAGSDKLAEFVHEAGTPSAHP